MRAPAHDTGVLPPHAVSTADLGGVPFAHLAPTGCVLDD